MLNPLVSLMGMGCPTARFVKWNLVGSRLRTSTQYTPDRFGFEEYDSVAPRALLPAKIAVAQSQRVFKVELKS
jgi:hypothetical protein